MTTSRANEIENRPWYRFGIVWLVIVLPMIAVVASVTTVYIAYQNAPEISASVLNK